MRFSVPLLLALLLSATAATAQPTPKKAPGQKIKVKRTSRPPASAAQAASVIEFRKTPCLGPCPEYDATIFADGRVRYMGRSNVPLMGAHTLKLPAATVKKVLADAQSLGFRKLREHYSQNTTDLPSTFLSIRQPDGTLKTVQVEEAAPAGLQALLDYLSQELDKVAGNTKPASR